MLGDRYSLTRRIAVGGMGEVWEATDLVLGRRVGIKILRDDLVDSQASWSDSEPKHDTPPDSPTTA